MTPTSPLVQPPAISPGLTVPRVAWDPPARALLIPELQELLERLHRELQPERAALLRARDARQERWDAGDGPAALQQEGPPEARGEWRVAALPSDLTRRRVEIVTPISERSAILDALSRSAGGTRADIAILDLEDSTKPSWSNLMRGWVDLVGAVDGTLPTRSDVTGGAGETVRLEPDDNPLIAVQVRGLHLVESNVEVDGEPISAGLFDLVGVSYWTARALLDQGRTPSVCIPKCEHQLEARWWSLLLDRIEEELDLPSRSIKATFSIETLPAACQMEAILFQARGHAAALVLGIDDLLFSTAKTLGRDAERLLADRESLTLERPWLRACWQELVAVCRRHGALALVDFATWAPPLDDERSRRLRAELELASERDGLRISHPDLLDIALETPADGRDATVGGGSSGQTALLPEGCRPRTRSGLRSSVRLAIAYLRGWNDGRGCTVVDGRRADLSSFEAARALTWQWLHHRVALEDGGRVTPGLLHELFDEELARLEREIAAPHDDVQAIESFRRARLDAETLFSEAELRPFLTTASEPAGMTLDQARARLRRDPTV